MTSTTLSVIHPSSCRFFTSSVEFNDSLCKSMNQVKFMKSRLFSSLTILLNIYKKIATNIPEHIRNDMYVNLENTTLRCIANR